MASKKHYIITSVTLGLIGAASAALIAVTNVVTRDKIAQNEKNKINAGIVEIFGKSATISEENEISDTYKYIERYYEIVDENDAKMGYAFRTTGSNMYGKISLIAGFSYDAHEFVGIYIVVNEQTYASTLVDNYISPLNTGKKEVDDVTCGATYGAKLVRDMIQEASEAVDSLGSN